MARNMVSNHIHSDRPLPTCKTSIVVTGTIFTLFKANTKEITKEVAGSATSFAVAAEGRHHCILALNQVNIVAVTIILVLHGGNGSTEHVWVGIVLLAIRIQNFSKYSTS